MIKQMYKKSDTEFFREKTLYTNLNDIPLYKLYHVNSELNDKNSMVLVHNINRALNDSEFILKCGQHKSFYEEKPEIQLPPPNKDMATENVLETLSRRRSIRNFSNEKVSMEELSTVLHYSSGLTGEYEESEHKPRLYLFAYPSAGGLMPLNSFIFINNVDNIERGIYYYDPVRHSLRVIKNFCSDDDHIKCTMSKELAQKASFIVYITGSLDLTGYKYSNRAYRFIMLEAGHLAQNLYLTSTAIGLGAVASGGFLDYELKEAVSLEEDYVLYEVFVGRPNKEAKDCRFL